MTWRESIGRAGRPVVLAIARVLRGESESSTFPQPISPQRIAAPPPPIHPTRSASMPEVEVEQPTKAKASTLPPWGILPSQIPPRIELLPGPSSIELLRRSRRISGWVVASYVVVVTAAFIIVGNPGAVALSAMVVLLIAGAVLGLIGPPYVERTKEEHHAGYTVWRRGTLWKPQVDVETGFVIRPAEAAGLTKQEEAAAQKRVREIARYLDDR